MTLRRSRNSCGISLKRAQEFFNCSALPGKVRTEHGSVWQLSQLASGPEGRSGGASGQREAIRLQIITSILGGGGGEPCEQLRGFTSAWEKSGNSDFPRPGYWTTIQAVVIYIPLTALFTQPAWMQISVWKWWRRWGVQPEGTGGLVLLM